MANSASDSAAARIGFSASNSAEFLATDFFRGIGFVSLFSCFILLIYY